VYERAWVQAECHALLVQSWLKEGGFRLAVEPREKAT
jgi:hypothetical protein